MSTELNYDVSQLPTWPSDEEESGAGVKGGEEKLWYSNPLQSGRRTPRKRTPDRPALSSGPKPGLAKAHTSLRSLLADAQAMRRVSQGGKDVEMLQEFRAVPLRDLNLSLFKVERNRALREGLLFLIWTFSVIIVLQTIADTPSAFGANLSVFEAILDEPWKDVIYKKNFAEIYTTGEAAEWLSGPLMDTLFPATKVGGEAYPNGTESTIHESQRLVGGMRLRTARVRDGTCEAGDTVLRECVDRVVFGTDKVECVNPYTSVSGVCFGWFVPGDTEEKGEWRLTNNKTLQWRDGLSPAEGLLGMGTGSYGTGGYVVDFDKNLTHDQAHEELSSLIQGRFLDERTRLLLVDFTTYDPASGLASAVRFQLEFLPTGFVARDTRFYTFRPAVYADVATIVGRLVPEAVYFVCLLLFTYRLIRAAIGRGVVKYCCRPSALLDLGVLSLAWASLAMWFTFSLTPARQSFHPDTDVYISYYEVGVLFSELLRVGGLLLFIMTLRLFKYMGQTRMGIESLWMTMSRAASDMLTFASGVMFVVVGFALFGVTAFGWGLFEFHNLASSGSSLLRFALGDFNFNELLELRPQLAGPFFALYIAVVFLVAFNLLGGILVDTFADVHMERKSGQRWQAGAGMLEDDVVRITTICRLRARIYIRSCARCIRFRCLNGRKLESGAVVVDKSSLGRFGVTCENLVHSSCGRDEDKGLEMSGELDDESTATASHDTTTSSTKSSSATGGTGGTDVVGEGGVGEGSSGSGVAGDDGKSAAATEEDKRREKGIAAMRRLLRSKSKRGGSVRNLFRKRKAKSHVPLDTLFEEMLRQREMEVAYLQAVGRCMDHARMSAEINLRKHVQHLYSFEPASDTLFVTEGSLSLLIERPSEALERQGQPHPFARGLVEAYHLMKQVMMQGIPRKFEPPVEAFLRLGKERAKTKGETRESGRARRKGEVVVTGGKKGERRGEKRSLQSLHDARSSTTSLRRLTVAAVATDPSAAGLADRDAIDPEILFFIHKVNSIGHLQRRILWLDKGYTADATKGGTGLNREPFLYNFDPNMRLRKRLPLRQLVQIDLSATHMKRLTLVFSSNGALEDDEDEVGRLDKSFDIIFASHERRSTFLSELRTTTNLIRREEDIELEAAMQYQ